MADQPKHVVPTRIIPPGEHLPPAVLEPGDWPPPRPPRPPRPAAPPPEPPPPAAPREVVHRVVVEMVQPEEESSRWSFAWLRNWLRPWQSFIAAALAVIPSPAYDGHSLSTAWAAVLNEARTDGLSTAYLLAALALAAALFLDIRTGRFLARTFLVVALIGGTGALGLYDPITWLTGVRP